MAHHSDEPLDPDMNLSGRGPLGLKAEKEPRDPERLERVKQLPCAVCGAAPPSDAHHCICGRYGQHKAPDSATIALCAEHHRIGPEAIHNGKRSWVEKHGPDTDYLDRTNELLAKWF